MSSQAQNGPKWRSRPFSGGPASPSPSPSAASAGGRPKSTATALPSTLSQTRPPSHSRHQSFSPLGSAPVPARSNSNRLRSNSLRNTISASGTFAPQFIKVDETADAGERVRGIEGENDFSGKRYVWIKDAEVAFVKGWVVQEMEGDRILVQCEDGTQREVEAESVDKVNPAKFDRANDMAELTHLNEASVVHNLNMRYKADLIYTYSGLFLVTVNPYSSLPIYTKEYINLYRGRSREDTKPHIFAMADEAFKNLVEEGQNQSILVTGESGAGKTENTKKVIQYLAAVATGDSPVSKSAGQQLSNLSQQILRANPILEAFGNAQTVRNNNSSRFGKFIRIEFTRSGQIAGAFIDWYLLEKSRVVKLNSNERSYHVFYQLLQGANQRMREELCLADRDASDFEYTKYGNKAITGVSDGEEWKSLVEAFHVMGFSDKEQKAVLRTVAAVLHLGNITVMKQSLRADQAALSEEAICQARVVCRLLGIEVDPFVKALLHPGVKAGREWVEKAQTPEQVRLGVDALAKGIYERTFDDLVNRLNRQLDRNAVSLDDTHFIGVLDIAGFEIFEENSFEQLCINYTNEKLQQFFNHHMFVLEQEEYAREKIEWKFIDFGRDLQPTIDLIELPNPIGIFSCLDEDSVMPKATDKTFTEKLHSLWDRKTPKYRRSLLTQGFMLTHYAAEVEYSTEGWLEKNKDPLNDNVTRLLAGSSDKHIAHLFADCADLNDESGSSRSRVKKGLFRTVAQRHKEQLSTLMSQLHSTHPHFVRCILPNHKKRPKLFSAPLVLDQLRCNGVLEGIRIARTGFPNRLQFSEFRQRYEVLCRDMPKEHLEGQVAASVMLEKLNLEKSFYRVGLTKVFFRAGVLAELEEQRDTLIRDIMSRFQSVARGFNQRRIASKRLYRAEAARIIQRNFQVYLELQANPWWRLFVRMRPLLGATRQAGEIKKREETIQKLEQKVQQEASNRQKMDEERRRAEGEIHRIQQTLESERALALDKDEIFKRLQTREVELNEKLAGALQDQEDLEQQLDQLLSTKQGVEEQAEFLRKDLERAGQVIAKLETEKEELHHRIVDLGISLAETEAQQSMRCEVEESLNQEIRMLNSHLALKERKLQEFEQRLLKSDQDLDDKLGVANKELQVSRKQIKDVLEENRHIRQQMSDLSATSTSYEDLVRQKESELAILKADLRRYEADRKCYDEEKQSLAAKHDKLQGRLRDVQAEMEAMTTQKAQLEREAADAKKSLEDKVSEGSNRKFLESQVEDLKTQLFHVQTELSRERQSRDDVQMLGEHKYTTLKRDHDALNEAKIIIEKEMYVQQDVLRRATEARSAAERERKDYQTELKSLRQKYIELQESKMEAETAAERKIMLQANERQAALRRELDTKSSQLAEAISERDRFSGEAQRLKQLIADSDSYRLHHDQHKERLERELVTVKGRLTASENDNRALLNKLQQKNLDIARSNSRASDSQRTRISHIQAEKIKLEEDKKSLSHQLEDALLTITSLEKQKEKLSLSLEDLNHEVAREHKATRGAEKASSAGNLQLAEANRNLECERQLRAQAQANTRALQASLDTVNTELRDCHDQLLILRKVFDPSAADFSSSYEAATPDITRIVDLARHLEAAQKALRTANERSSRAEAQLEGIRNKHDDESIDVGILRQSSKRGLLEEMNQSQLNAMRSPLPLRDSKNMRSFSPKLSTPDQRHISNATNGSIRSDRTVDTVSYNSRMDLAAELELLQNQLQMSEMRNRHLQSQIDRSLNNNGWQDESPSVRRVQKLERENFRLHDMLDDSAKKVSALENSIHTGQLSLKEVQTKSHEELFDLISSQEQSRRSLLQVHGTTVAELAEAKTSFEVIKQSKTFIEVELRDLRSELEELSHERAQEAASRTQLLQEFSDLQIRLDTETSKLVDATSSLKLYKNRADEYFSKLEQAEIAVLKASKAEQFAKSQAQEAENTCAVIMSERKQVDGMLEDLQRQTQQYEERIEDLVADVESALQAKKRLQNELEDYRSQRAIDLEDKESSMEQTRKKYQSELSTMTNELEFERENVISVRTENSRLRDELEELRSKWDDEVLNSSAWSKEKSRLELTLQDLSNSRDEAINAHNEAQGKIVSLLSQVRNLRTAVDDATAERDLALKEKRAIEGRLAEAGERLENLAQGESPSMRNAASADRELLELKAGLAQQEDIASAAVGKMRRAEALAQEIQKDLGVERETNGQLHKEKAGLEKTVKDLQLKLVDLETKGYSTASHDVRFLHGRVQELEKQVEELESVRTKEQRSVRNVDRTVRDLQSQIERRDKQSAQLSDEISQCRDKIQRLLTTIDELQSSDSANQLAAKRAERELREEREKGLRLERELEGWKGLRMERDSLRRSGIAIGLSDAGGSRRGSMTLGVENIPQRRVSNTKGFL